jgi:CRP/FNR family cyclic AMP-dependent transcriptional regulator
MTTMTERPEPLPLPAVLASAGVVSTMVQYRPGDAIFSQGDRCAHVWYIHSGAVKVSVQSRVGKEAVVALLGPGDFLGERSLAGQPSHTSSATALTPSAVAAIAKHDMLRVLRAQQAVSERFIAHLLARNIRIEEEVIDHLFNTSEQRLARTLLRLARQGTSTAPDRIVLRVSQATLAQMIGTTRARVNVFLNKFRKLGVIEYTRQRPLTIHTTSLTRLVQE